MTKTPNFSIFQSLYFFFGFDRLRGLGRFKGSARKRLVVQYFFMSRYLQCCERKYLKFTPKMTKTPKFSIFQSFHAFFVKFLKDFVNLKDLKVQQGKIWLFSRLNEEFIAFFRMKMCQIDTENYKKLKIFHFSKFLFFC